MIIEGIITTENAAGALHIAPIGPHIDSSRKRWQIKPFQTSDTFKNFVRNNKAVFHITDDAFLLAGSLLGLGNTTAATKLPPDEHAAWTARLQPRLAATYQPEFGWVLQDCCEFFALSAMEWNLENPRATAECNVTKHDILRPFWGWNRAKHSILELAVIVSRLHLLPESEVRAEFARHTEIIHKTAGDDELQALELLTLALSR